jgi:hypothetical protein
VDTFKAPHPCAPPSQKPHDAGTGNYALVRWSTPVSLIPEPASLGLLAIGTLALLKRR